MRNFKFRILSIILCAILVLPFFGFSVSAASENVSYQKPVVISDGGVTASSYLTDGSGQLCAAKNYDSADVTVYFEIDLEGLYELSSCKIIFRGDSYNPENFTIDVYSGSEWVEVKRVTGFTASQSMYTETYDFPSNVQGTKIRIQATKLGLGKRGYSMQLHGIEVYGTLIKQTKGMPYNVTATIYDAQEGEYGVVWHSTVNHAEPTIQVVSKNDNFNESLSKYYNVTVSEANGYYIYKGIISGLDSSTCYYYRVGDKSVDLFTDWRSFVTSSLDDSAFTFFHMTDTQAHYSQWNTVLSSAFSLYDDARLIVHTGDVVEWGPDNEEWRTAFEVTKDYLSNTLMTSIAGSHHESQGSELYDHFNFKIPNNQNPNGGLHYSYDYNNVHFTMIDINDYSTATKQLGQVQIQWLIQDLKNTDKEWKVVGLHWSMFSAGQRLLQPEISAIRAQLEPIFSEYNVDLVLSGHDHVYTRTYPIKNGSVVEDIETAYVTIGDKNTLFDVNPNGTVYLMSNTSGYRFYELTYPGEWFSAKDGQPNQSMFSAITVDGNKLIINAYTVNQSTGVTTLYDTYAMMKADAEGDGNEDTGNEGTGNQGNAGTGNQGTGNQGNAGTGNEGTGNEGTGNQGNEGTGNEGTGNANNGNSTASTVGADSPKTGDNPYIIVYTLFIIEMGSIFIILYLEKKRGSKF